MAGADGRSVLGQSTSMFTLSASLPPVRSNATTVTKIQCIEWTDRPVDVAALRVLVVVVHPFLFVRICPDRCVEVEQVGVADHRTDSSGCANLQSSAVTATPTTCPAEEFSGTFSSSRAIGLVRTRAPWCPPCWSSLSPRATRALCPLRSWPAPAPGMTCRAPVPSVGSIVVVEPAYLWSPVGECVGAALLVLHIGIVVDVGPSRVHGGVPDHLQARGRFFQPPTVPVVIRARHHRRREWRGRRLIDVRHPD